MTKKSVRVLRELQGWTPAQLDDKDCLYCMDSGKCCECEGQGSTRSSTGGLRLCQYCNGSGACSMCERGERRALKRLSA